MKLIKSNIALLLSFLLVFSACTEDDEKMINPGEAPDLPPIESISFNSADFSTDNSGGRVNAATNWEVAALNVVFWNAVAGSQIAIPVASFKAAVGKEPTFDIDRGLWVWNFTYDVLSRGYSAELTADVMESEVQWKMYISQEKGFQDVLWFTGVMLLDGSTGSWSINKDADNPTEYLKIDWNKENDEVGDIKFTYTCEGAKEQGSYIEYAETNGADFNRLYNIHMTTADNDVNIEWHSENNNGRIKAPGYYKDDNFHCWDANFENTDCK